MKEHEKINEELAITLDNFEALAKKYRPLILANIKRVHKMYEVNCRVEFDDLFQEGLMALYDCIKHFDATRGVFFSVYLKVSIANKLKCFCRNYLPHYYSKDTVNSTPERPKFKRERVNVGTLSDVKSYLM